MEPAAEHLTSLVGPFYGNGLTRPKLDAALSRFWTAEQTYREPEIINKAWFDYRFAHPALRAMFFAHCYTVSWRKAWLRYVNRLDDVSEIIPWRSRDLYACPQQVISATITSMQFADELRIPYDTFFDAGFHHLLQEVGYTNSEARRASSNLKAHKLPPVRMFKRASLAVAAQKAWEKQTASTIVYATHPFYQMKNWRNDPWQVEHIKWLVSETKRRGSDSTSHLHALFSLGVLPSGIISPT